MKHFPRQLTEWQRGWISGLLDTDGAIGFNRNNGRKKWITARIQVDNRSRSLIEKVLKIVGSGHISHSRTQNPSKGMLGKTYSPMFRFAAGAGVMTWLLPQLKLSGKEEQRTIMIKSLPLLRRNKWRTESQSIKLEQFYKRMAVLNSVEYDRSKSL